jgi:hypothetical protein
MCIHSRSKSETFEQQTMENIGGKLYLPYIYWKNFQMQTIDSVFFHEDDYCQRELLPLASLLSNLNKAENAIYVAQENYTSYGFSGLYNNDATVISLEVLNISLADFEKVYTGYSTERTLKDDVGAFGFENYIIYYKFNNGIVVKSWLDFSALLDESKIHPQMLISSLNDLGLTYNLILADWIENLTVNLKNTQIISDYFNEILQ